MKRMKKIVSILLAVVMTLGMSMTVFASNLTGGVEVTKTITVKGLQEGDIVTFYQVLEWETDKNTGKPTGNGWVPANGFNWDESDLEVVIGDKDAAGEISSIVAGKLGSQVKGKPATTVPANADGIAKVDNPAAGLYMAIITPAITGYVYNPVFVSANYSSENNEHTVDTDSSYSEANPLSPSYNSNIAIAKLSIITVDKTASTKEDTNEDGEAETVAAGDPISFTVETVIPDYATNYTAPVFKVTDELSDGLTLDATSIVLSKPTGLTKGEKNTDGDVVKGDYAITVLGARSFEVAFSAAYLKTVRATAEDKKVQINYDATVTNATLVNSVNQEDNTVTVNFSNHPGDTEGHGVLRDKTNHYTFDIDGQLFGRTGYEATEVVKIGVDKYGNEITKSTRLANGESVGALQGAEFRLYKTAACADGDLYTNALFDGSVISGADGRINIRGLDAGTYWLKEISAPAGYIKEQDAVKIEIEAKIGEVVVTEKIDGTDVTYKTNVLESYTVKIADVTTATYTLTNEAKDKKTTQITEVTQGDTVVGTDDNSGKIKNTRGVELPSTGGIGTTIFYVVGATLVICAGILLVVKKRMSNRRE